MRRLLTAGWVVPVSAPPIRDGAVLVEDGVIAAVGPAAAAGGWQAPDRIDDHGPGAIILPGLVDAHCHLEWSCFGGVVGPRPFGAWLAAFMPLRGRMDAGDHAAAALHGALRAARAGTTTVADSGPTGAGAGALGEVGMRGIVHVEAFGAPGDGEAPAAADAVAERVAAVAARAPARVAVGVSPHAPYSAGPALWRALAADPRLSALPWSTHVAESPDEERAVLDGDGPIAELFAAAGFPMGRWADGGDSVVARLDAHGALRRGMVAAHCVRLRRGDAAILRRAGVRVAHCPRSNAHLGCGTAPVPALFGAGVAVALGTDSPASGGDYDLRAEARACRDLFAAAAPPDHQLLRMITHDAARALGMGDVVGALEPGMRADLLVLDAAAAGQDADAGAAGVHARALAAGSRVRATLVDGAPVVEDGRPRHPDAAAADAAAAAITARLR